ncbi:MAG: class I SAM-dependent methyltransferase [candidate division KSB1 bacterium]|nr:class I SAM-dependent methyltransferase [candidate division KSB1 bacterium]
MQCPICESGDLQTVLEMRNVPVYCNVLLDDPEEALSVPRGDVKLSVCPVCGHGVNCAFESARVGYERLNYENSLHFSQTFRRFARRLARSLVQRYGLRGRTILEIGCGRGDYLRLLRDLAQTKGIGFDPGLAATDIPTEDPQIRLLPVSFQPELVPEEVDFVIGRHVLEHLEHPAELLRDLREGLPATKQLWGYFEVPNFDWIVQRVAVLDVIYEHVHYFSHNSLQELFVKVGYGVRHCRSTYHDQYLGAEVEFWPLRSTRRRRPQRAPQMRGLQDFRVRCERFLQRWREFFFEQLRAGRKIVLWGIGSKAVNLLNLLELGSQPVWLIDQNPRKQGRYAAGTALVILAPEQARSIRPDIVLALNPAYRHEVQNTMAKLGVQCEVLAVQ